MHHVYAYVNRVNRKVYIGQTVKPLRQRSGKRGSDYVRCRRFWGAIRKYGWEEFEPQILLSVESKQVADAFERLAIAAIGTQDPAYGYNLREGGSRGCHSEQPILRCRLAKRGKPKSAKHRLAISLACKGNANHRGHRHSAASKALMSTAFKGKTWSLVDGKRVWFATKVR